MMGERPQAPQNSPSLASAATKAAGPEPSGTSIAANAMGISVGRLIGERAFHFGASTPGGLASRSLAMDAAFASAADLSPQAKLNGEGAPALGASQAEATLPQPFADVVQSTAPARIPARAGSPVTNRVSPREPRRTKPRGADQDWKPRRLSRPSRLRVQAQALHLRAQAAMARRTTVASPIRSRPWRNRRRRQVRLAGFSRRVSLRTHRSSSAPLPLEQPPRRPRAGARQLQTPSLLPSRLERSMSTFRRAASRTSR